MYPTWSDIVAGTVEYEIETLLWKTGGAVQKKDQRTKPVHRNKTRWQKFAVKYKV